MREFEHQWTVTNEALAVLSTLSKPSTGFSKLEFSNWYTLGDKVSPTVIE